MKSAKLLLFLMRLTLVLIVLVFPSILIYVYIFVLYSGDSIQAQVAINQMEELACSHQEKDGVSGFQEVTEHGFSYFVKTPLNYQSEKAWPLLLVFSPSMNAYFMERYTGLTGPLTQAGFVIAYVNAVPMKLDTILHLPELAKHIEKHFCIDSKKIFLAGHSDGATISQALNVLPESQALFAGFVSSAGGFTQSDLQAYSCPANKKVMLLQNEDDQHFRNFSSSALKWWLACNDCDENNKAVGPTGCQHYQCARGELVFCEQPGGHLAWPRRQKEIVDFLQ